MFAYTNCGSRLLPRSTFTVALSPDLALRTRALCSSQAAAAVDRSSPLNIAHRAVPPPLSCFSSFSRTLAPFSSFIYAYPWRPRFPSSKSSSSSPALGAWVIPPFSARFGISRKAGSEFHPRFASHHRHLTQRTHARTLSLARSRTDPIYCLDKGKGHEGTVLGYGGAGAQQLLLAPM